MLLVLRFGVLHAVNHLASPVASLNHSHLGKRSVNTLPHAGRRRRDAAALLLHDGGGHCEADAHAVLGGVPAAVEAAEYVRQIGFVDAFTGVTDTHLREQRVFLARDADLAALRRVLRAVFEHVEQRLAVQFSSQVISASPTSMRRVRF